jgi:predicted nucleic acid-binding protein
VWYLDTSACVKLVLHEPETPTLRRWLRGEEVVSSDLLRAELIRAVRRHDVRLLGAALRVLEAVELVAVERSAWQRAGYLDPSGLRTLDAVHLAVAIGLADAISGIVTYDRRLAAAATANGLAVAAPV